MTTDHRAEAERYLPPNEATYATAHLLAAIHDLLAERLPTKGDPCPCGCRRNVDPTPEVSEYRPCLPSLGDRCGNCHRCTDPEPETVTVTLPRDVAKKAVSALYEAAGALRHGGNDLDAGLADEAGRKLARAYIDALDAANGSLEADQ